jgi:LPS O-antigen subunit length determinant protein (WzzB/FepE family)
MNNKLKFTNNDENSYFLLLIWKNKFFVLATALIFAVFSFAYQNFFLKKFDIQITNVVIKKPIGQIFNIYSEFIINPLIGSQLAVDESFFNNFKVQLNSTDNLNKFLLFYTSKKKQNNENDSEIYKKLYSKIKIIQKEKNSNQFFLQFPKQINGPDFLNDYILFTYYINVEDFIDDLRVSLHFQRDKLNLEIDSQNALRIERINRILNDLNNDKFKFDPILDKAKSSTALTDKKIYIYMGFILGIFISIVFIFFRTAFLNSK